MLGAGSTAVDIHSSRARLKRQAPQGRSTIESSLIDVEQPIRSSIIDIEQPIRAVPLADIAPARQEVEDVRPRERSETLCRALNIAIAAVAMICLSPLYFLIALAVKLTSRGPVLYSHARVGVDRRYRETVAFDRRGYDHGGKLFMMYKFRTMHANAESNGQAVWATKRDPRVTAVGRILRRTRLDELPQFYNVLRGDMNIVGPRPERPTIFADLRTNIPEYYMRQRVKPGITGWAQVNQAYDVCVDDVRRKVQYDLEYVRRQGLYEDVRIMSMTLPVMLFGKGGW
jgi:lipopolysaccharide/colanic/teichoic acid biosynthesis glycosyltransferase